MNENLIDSVERDTGSTTPTDIWPNIISVMLRYWKFIFQCLIVSGLTTIVVAILIPNRYESTASVLPFDDLNVLSMLEGSSFPVKSFMESKTISFSKNLTRLIRSEEIDRYLSILKSRTTLYTIVQKFDLSKVYGITSYPMEKTIKKLSENVDYEVNWEGNLSITVSDKDPQRAADIANYFMEMINKTDWEMRGQYSRGNRQYITQRYERNLQGLADAIDSLKKFQEKLSVIKMPEQIESFITTSADLASQLAMKEVQANVLKRTTQPDDPALKAIELEISELKNKLHTIVVGTNASMDVINVFPPFKKVPGIEQDYMRWINNIELQDTLLYFITSIYKQAQMIEEQKVPSVFLFDPAKPSEHRSSPSRLFIILGGILIGGSAAFTFAFFYDFWINEKEINTFFYSSLLSLSDVIRTEGFLFKALKLRMKTDKN